MSWKPRKWQAACQQRENEFWERDNSNVFFLEACPAAGKSTKALMTAKTWLDSDVCQCVFVVAPWKSILSSVEAQADIFKLRTNRNLFIGSGYQYPPHDDVLILTNHRLCKRRGVDALSQWVERHDFSFGLIIDEIHHGDVSNSWGMHFDQIGSLAKRIMIMSGTPFRADKNAIQFMKYHNNTAQPDYQLTYYDAVQEGYVRNVACRYVSSDYLLRLNSSGDVRQRRMEELNSAEVASIANTLFCADSTELKELIRVTHSDLMRIRTDPRYSDAAALFVCRPGKRHVEERHVLQAARVIQETTGIAPVVVTNNDADAEGKLKRFRESDDPYLVAINMVSEGCDIPRIHAVSFLRLVRSEMLFRQIVGRALRRRNERDTEPAMIYLPKIEPMAGWAAALYHEADTAIKEMKACQACGSVPCMCDPVSCGDCGASPCLCAKCEECGRKLWLCCCDAEPKHELLEAALADGGGHFVSDEVDPQFIAKAEYIAFNYPQHRAINTVATGHLLQISAAQASTSPGIEQQKQHLRDQIARLLRRITTADWSIESVFETVVTRHMPAATFDKLASLPLVDLGRISRLLAEYLGD